MKWQAIIILLLLIPSASAVDLLSGTILNTTVSNTSMSFEQCELMVDISTVTNVSIELTNPVYITPGQQFSLPNFINFSTENAHLDCGQLGPVFGTADFQCTSIERGTFSLIIIVSTLALLTFVFSLFIGRKDTPRATINTKLVTFIFVGIIIGVVFIIAIADTIVEFCPL